MKKIFFAILLINICIFATQVFDFLSQNSCYAATVVQNTLTKKERDIVFISSYTAKGDLQNLRIALYNALDHKMTRYEIKEILIQMYAYCGFPRSLNALTTFMGVLDERDVKGIYDEYGKEPLDLPVNANRYSIGATIQTELTGAPVTGRIFEFEPDMDKYLKEHLFADIFSRGVLSYEEREIATISALSSMNDVEPQLMAHIQIAQNIGLEKSKIDEILKLTEYKVFKNEIFSRGNPNTAYAQYFKGKSYLNMLNQEGINIANVTFEPGCRNNWHIHHKGGQVLLVLQGEGYYQEFGKPVRLLKAGDVVNILPEVKHWHGATKNNWFVHISVEIPAKNSYTEWLEPVSDEYYNKLQF